MLLIGGLNDELRETQGEIFVEWTLVDFRNLSQEEGGYYQSPIFSFATLNWRLQVYPGGNNVLNEATTKWISVYLKCHSLFELEQPILVGYNLGIKKYDGTTEAVIRDKKHNFDKNNSVAGLQKFFKSSEIILRKNTLMPRDELTFVCTLKHDSQNIVPAKTQSMKLIELDRLSTDFKDLLTSKRNCDAVVHVKYKEFQVHKCVLIARSPVFASMFQHDMAEKRTGKICISDCDPVFFGDFLQYLYTGKIENISSFNVSHLYCTADKYDVQELKSFCVTFMVKNLKVKNICDVVKLGEQYDDADLLRAAQAFFNKNASLILSTVKWETLMQENYRLANKLFKGMAMKIKI